MEIRSSNGEVHSKTFDGQDPGGLALTFMKPKKLSAQIANADNAYVYIELSETGIYGTKVRLGQVTFKLSYCREGVRSIPLCDRYNQPHPCASLLLYTKKMTLSQVSDKWLEEIHNNDTPEDTDTRPLLAEEADQDSMISSWLANCVIDPKLTKDDNFA